MPIEGTVPNWLAVTPFFTFNKKSYEKRCFRLVFGWGIDRGHLQHHFKLSWARIAFLITENWLFEVQNDPQNDLFFGHFKVKISHFCGSFWSSKSQFSVIRNEILAHNSSKWCLRCPLPIPHPKKGENIAFHAIFCRTLGCMSKNQSTNWGEKLNKIMK